MKEVEYRLSIAPALEEFRPEIEYACSFLDSCHFVTRVERAERTLHYGQGAPSGAITVPAHLFPAGVRTDHGGIYPELTALKPIVAEHAGGLRPLLEAQLPGQDLGYDALGLMFLLLSRLEERDHPDRDRYDRFPLSASLFQPQDGRLYPFADRAAHDLASAITGQRRNASRTHYDVHFSHDVDILRGYHRPLAPLREAAGDIIKRAQPAKALQRLRSAYFGGEPWRSSRNLMKLSERHGLKSHFFFMGPSEDHMDSPYAVRLPGLLRRVAKEINARGHVIGFHPGFHTAQDKAEWCRQRDGLETIIGRKITEGRQHVLRYDAAVTPRIWSNAGMTLDCTPAYPEAVGFRTGTCRIHKAYDLIARKTLALNQLSTAVMEFGLFGGKYRELSQEEALKEAGWAIDLCQEYGGTFALLFHTGQNEPHLWQWLEAVVRMAAGKDGFASLSN